MKFIKIFILSFLILFIQVAYISKISIFGNYFNILIPFIVLMAIKYDYFLFIIFFLGLLYDALYPITFGLNGMVFLILSYVLHTCRNYFNFENLLILLSIMFSANIFYYFAMFLLYLFTNDKIVSVSFILMITLNTLLSTFLFFLYNLFLKLNINFSDE